MRLVRQRVAFISTCGEKNKEATGVAHRPQMIDITQF